jgi:hypothetical protein
MGIVFISVATRISGSQRNWINQNARINLRRALPLGSGNSTILRELQKYYLDVKFAPQLYMTL